MKHLGLFGCLVTVVLASACSKDETVDSTDIRTSGIYPEFTVTAEGDGNATVSVTLKVGGNDSNTTLDLKAPDELVCTADGTDKTLKKSGSAYKATFGTDAGGTEFVFAFNRGTADDNAPDSHVALPDPFKLDGVDATTEISRTDGKLDVTWDASDANDTSTWTLDGDCLFTTDGKVSTDGKLTLSGDNFNGTPSADDKNATAEESTCKATLCVDRKLVGSLDAAFSKDGGEIRAIQRRCISFISTK